ncbi:hypothetical protein G6F18_012300 [Rhizopus arrhizus]|nr:hypothetical protein G6F20_012251 [Rhizopus arrhizus]KAG0821181.1 hypothetical protein G6F18_012300 [Rhizopus arrhizus]KAG1392969.1 hypothetical protein G6F60_011765 [Rhizopus arrhizus]
MDTLQVVNAIYKHSENTRTMARAVTELYEQIQYLQTSASIINPMELAKIQSECREAAKRLAVYGWASARTQDNQATEFAAKAIKVPYNVAMDYLPEEGTKRQAFSKEFVREYNQVSHQNALNRAAVNNKPTGTDSRYGGRGRATETTSLQQSSKAIDLQHSIQNNNYSIPSDGIQPGGRLNKFYNNWIKVISHKWPLSVIREGYKIQLNSNPIPWKLKKMNLKLEDQIAVDQAVEKFMTAGKIEISPSQSRDYLSNFFTIQEATKRRPILDCKMINNYIQCHHFKMEGVPALRESTDLQQNYALCYRTFEERGHTYDLIFRRHLFTSEIRRRNEDCQFQSVKTSGGSRVYYQFNEECINAVENTTVFRLPIQHQEDVNYCAARKDQQTDQEGETSSEGRLQLQLQVDSKSIGEDDFHVTSDSRRCHVLTCQ